MVRNVVVEGFPTFKIHNPVSCIGQNTATRVLALSCGRSASGRGGAVNESDRIAIAKSILVTGALIDLCACDGAEKTGEQD
jgi:hypothetical protein